MLLLAQLWSAVGGGGCPRQARRAGEIRGPRYNIEQGRRRGPGAPNLPVLWGGPERRRSATAGRHPPTVSTALNGGPLLVRDAQRRQGGGWLKKKWTAEQACVACPTSCSWPVTARRAKNSWLRSRLVRAADECEPPTWNREYFNPGFARPHSMLEKKYSKRGYDEREKSMS